MNAEYFNTFPFLQHCSPLDYRVLRLENKFYQNGHFMIYLLTQYSLSKALVAESERIIAYGPEPVLFK